MPISPALRIFAWLSFVAEVLIIATGGAVRLTGSGLGCSEWPMCTPDSLVPTAEQRRRLAEAFSDITGRPDPGQARRGQ